MAFLNENKTQRYVGLFFLIVSIGVFVFFLLWDGWIFEWLQYGFNGKSQHFDFDIFGDMQWELIGDERVYYSTNSVHFVFYICHWTGIINSLALLTGNKWLRQGSMATMAFSTMTFFSTINPIIAKNTFDPALLTYHLYPQQIVSNISHGTGIIMCVYLFYIAAKKGEELEKKYYIPTILFTWVLYLLAKFFQSPQPFWEYDGAELAYYGTNQVNDMPFYFYGVEYILVVAFLFLINLIVNIANRRISNPKYKTLFPFLFFVSFTIIFVATEMIIIQEIPWTAFQQ